MFNAYPMPWMDVLTDRVGEAQVFSTIELTKGYWQISLAKQAQEKTAFTTPSGLYHFLKMPFGLHGAAASFQKLMDRTLKDVHACVVACIDDILIFSPTWEANLKHLRRVLDAGVAANLKKIHLGRKSMHTWAFALEVGKSRLYLIKWPPYRTPPCP